MQPEDAFSACREAVTALRVEPVTARKTRLLDFRRWIRRHHTEIKSAVHADFRKPPVETGGSEIFHVLNEIRVAVRNLAHWSAPRPVPTPFFLPGSNAFVQYEPRGVTLILSPWNYPFSLAAGPLVSALAAGNSVILKPSEHTPAVSALLRKMAGEVFDPSLVYVAEGDAAMAQRLLALPFDHIFFTGSPETGRKIMAAAAEHLTPVTLELGGKSPAIVTATASVEAAARSIAFGKFLNNGQTCVAPDYVLADERIAPQLINALARHTASLFSADGNFETSSSYCRIVNDHHFRRISALIDEAVAQGARVVLRGETNPATRFISPVILEGVPAGCRILREEIFGPVLPVITYTTPEDAVSFVHGLPRPLSLYVFASGDAEPRYFLQRISAGSACINDCAVQFVHHHLPFGGVNQSGMGRAHGFAGFREFSNEKSVLHQSRFWSPLRLFYPPYTARTGKVLDWFLKHL